MKRSVTSLFVGFICLLYSENALSTTLTTNFADASLSAGIYANGAAINSGTLNLNVTNTIGSPNYVVQVATSSISSNKVIQLIDNISTAQQVGGVNTNVASLVSSSGGYLSGSCSFTPLTITSGTRGLFVVSVASSSGTSSDTSAFQISVAPDLTVSYYAGTTYTVAKNGGTNVVLSAGSQYSFQWWVDLSSSQDKYGFSIYNASDTLLFSSGTINTRAANISTTTVYYQLFAGNETGGPYASSDPFIEINSIAVTNAIPEPQTWALVAFGFVLLAFVHRARILAHRRA